MALFNVGNGRRTPLYLVRLAALRGLHGTRMGDIVCEQLKRPWDYAESGKELFMKNQTNVNDGASPELQAMGDPASKDISGQGPAADSSTGTPVPADGANQSGAPGPMAPDSAKGGHV